MKKDGWFLKKTDNRKTSNFAAKETDEDKKKVVFIAEWKNNEFKDMKNHEVFLITGADIFWTDSGATDHMICNDEFFSTSKMIDEQYQMKLRSEIRECE